MLTMYLAVAVGGAAGSVARYYISSQALRLLGGAFPWGTLSVNVAGSLLMGVMAGHFSTTIQLSHELRAMLTVGFLGGFTTFSAFSLDVSQLMQRQQIGMAAIYAIVSVVFSVAALFAGLVVVRRALG